MHLLSLVMYDNVSDDLLMMKWPSGALKYSPLPVKLLKLICTLKSDHPSHVEAVHFLNFCTNLELKDKLASL